MQISIAPRSPEAEMAILDALTIIEKTARNAREFLVQRRSAHRAMRSAPVLIARAGQNPQHVRDPRSDAAQAAQHLDQLLSRELPALFGNAQLLMDILANAVQPGDANEPESAQQEDAAPPLASIGV